MKRVSKNIENSGLTTKRQVILRVIRESDKHLTASEVFEDARRYLHGISFATVYNSLRFLKDAGYISEISFGNKSSRFDALTLRHDHALCTKCGGLIDMKIELPSEVVNQAAEFSHFKVQSIELILRGLCPECSEQQD